MLAQTRELLHGSGDVSIFFHFLKKVLKMATVLFFTVMGYGMR